MCLGAVAAGTALAWTSPVLPQITPVKNSSLNGTANAIATVLTPINGTDLTTPTTPATITTLANITALAATPPSVVPTKKDIILNKDQGTLTSVSKINIVFVFKLFSSFLNYYVGYSYLPF